MLKRDINFIPWSSNLRARN